MLDREWAARFAADRELRRKWEALVGRFRQWLLTNKTIGRHTSGDTRRVCHENNIAFGGRWSRTTRERRSMTP